MRGGARLLVLILVCLGLGACATLPPAPDPQIERDAIAARMMRDIDVLASDEFGGRKPGTPGGEQTIAYIIERMQEIGLQSGTNDPGSAWRAPVELVSSEPLDHTITVRTANGTSILPMESSLAFSLSSRVLIDGVEVIFVGNGIRDIAPSELRGRIVILTDGGNDRSVAETLFAADPAAVLTVVPGRVALERQRSRFARERLLLASEASDRLSAFVTSDAIAKALPEGEWEKLTQRSDQRGFDFELLEATIAIDVRSVRREFTSSNVIGVIPGQVPGSGAVLLMAHWDHLGECAAGTPDPICNGAIDNASGVALILELAQRLKSKGLYDRDIYLLATSAEEAGLLGAKAFAKAPPVPLDTIVAAFNFDSVAVARAGSAVGFIGEGRTPLDSVIKEVLSERGAQLGNREYAASFLQRHDGWALLEEGVPSVLLSTAFSSEIVLGPYLATRYHRPSDEVGGDEVGSDEVGRDKAQGLEMGGAVDDLLLHEALVTRIANTLSYPASNAGSDTSVSQ